MSETISRRLIRNPNRVAHLEGGPHSGKRIPCDGQWMLLGDEMPQGGRSTRQHRYEAVGDEFSKDGRLRILMQFVRTTEGGFT